MGKFVITYTFDGGDNAECTPAVHCVECESLEKLKEDFKSFLIKEGKADNEWDAKFLGNSFNIEDLQYGQYNKEIKKYEYFAAEENYQILPLDEWFEEWKTNHKDGY